MLRDKAASYLGFARRAGKLTLGMNGAATVKKCALLVADRGAGKTSQERIVRLRAKLGCPLVWCDGLGDMVGSPSCVIAAVRDEGFAKAISAALGAGV